MTRCRHCGGSLIHTLVDDTSLEVGLVCLSCGRPHADERPIPEQRIWNGHGRAPHLTYCEAAAIAMLLRQGHHLAEISAGWPCSRAVVHRIRGGQYYARA